MERKGVIRPISSYIMQDLLQFADSWGTRLSLFFIMTGSFIQILIGMEPSGTVSLAVFNVILFSLSIASSLYAYDVDPNLNTLFIFYASIAILLYLVALGNIVDIPSPTGGVDPLGEMAGRLESNGYAVQTFSKPGSNIPSYNVSKGSEKYQLHCLHNSRYDPSFFESRVTGDTVGEVRDRGYHCKVQSETADSIPTELAQSVTGISDTEPQEPSQDDEEDPAGDDASTQGTVEQKEPSNTTNTTSRNKTEESATTVATNDAEEAQTLRDRVKQTEYQVEVSPENPGVDDQVDLRFTNPGEAFEKSKEWDVEGSGTYDGDSASVSFDESGAYSVSVSLNVNGSSDEIVLVEKIISVEDADDETASPEDSTGQEPQPSPYEQDQESVVVEPLPTEPQIAYWCGKVNQHRENGEWQTDPDGVSGCEEDKLAYCQRFYPETESVERAGEEQIDGWKNAGNTGSFSTTKMTYDCVQP